MHWENIPLSIPSCICLALLEPVQMRQTAMIEIPSEPDALLSF